MQLSDDRNRILDLITGQAIQADLEFLRRFGSSFANQVDENRAVAFATGSFPLLALMVHEIDKQSTLMSEVPGFSFLEADSQEPIRRARHALKFFDDSELKFDGYLALFGARLAETERENGELDLMFVDGRVVSTTLTFSVFSGSSTSDISSVGHVAEAIGSFTKLFDFGFEPRAMSSLQRSIDAPVSFVSVTGHALYNWSFDGPERPALNAVLISMLSLANFVTVLGEFEPAASASTVFKLRFITVFTIIRSLVLIREREHSATSDIHLSTILGDIRCEKFVSREWKWLRDFLIHYRPNPRIDFEQVDLTKPLAGIPEQLTGERFEDVVEYLDAALEVLVGALGKWSFFLGKK